MHIIPLNSGGMHIGFNIVFEEKSKTCNMKKLITILVLAPWFILAMIIAPSCTKEGPQGPAGEDGIDGTDGTASCGQCHNEDEGLLARVIQWEASVHATGGNFERNSSSCAPCHTSMGFREVVLSGENTTAASIDNPTPINCYTCHNIHETYEVEDWGLRYIEPVTYLEGGAIVDNGNANLCTKCHQSRAAEPYPAAGSGEIVFPEDASYRWGPHHGPQSNLYAGVGASGAYELGGNYENSWHTANLSDPCITCHMATPFGAQAGGHTFNMGYEYHGSFELNTAGCVSSDCHGSADNLVVSVETKQAEIEDLLADLKVLLEDNGIMDTVAHPGYLNVPGTYPNELAGAFYNYKLIEEDRSHGMHNYKYTKTLLENSIEAIQ